ncbi:GlxA family transcriptional regulator [Actinomadura litoris]|uniref:GlxA family transcriptional regulator n=1 Tax=Actinomadura litoris TaxID=2678616 RepID=UPI001FA73DDB|nr:helix-turn-helix domain-containing protein [Actinomadura litoris]
MPTVALAITDRISLVDVAAPCEIFGVDRSDLADPWYDFTVCGPAGARVGDWFRPASPASLDGLVSADTVIVPASHRLRESPPADLVAAVRAAYERGSRVASICTGAFVLAAAGLLDGRRATTHWMHTAALAARCPEARVDPDALYVDEGRVLTSAGKSAGFDLCLHLVRLDHGATAANDVAGQLVLPPRPDGGRARPIQAAGGEDPVLSALEPWVAAHLHRPLTVGELARQANMSTRHLTRKFNAITGMTPLQWLLARRIRRARELLETTDECVEQIAVRTGMGTAATLRRNFNRAVGVPPDTYRRTFRTGPQVARRFA